MVRVECVATQGFVTFISMPLLTELFSIKDGFSYKHGAPNGAVTTSPYRIAPKIARFVPICAMEDIGIEDDWELAQRIFILSGVPKGMGVSTGNSEEASVLKDGIGL
jgi:hypothetical protein